MPGDHNLADRLLAARRLIADRVDRGAGCDAVLTPPALAQALAARAAELDDGGASRERRAIHNRSEVARMSAAGRAVAEIAATLQLSTRHVVKLRAQLGLGRRRTSEDAGHAARGTRG